MSKTQYSAPSMSYNQMRNQIRQPFACYACGAPDHYPSQCPRKVCSLPVALAAPAESTHKTGTPYNSSSQAGQVTWNNAFYPRNNIQNTAVITRFNRDGTIASSAGPEINQLNEYMHWPNAPQATYVQGGCPPSLVKHEQSHTAGPQQTFVHINPYEYATSNNYDPSPSGSGGYGYSNGTVTTPSYNPSPYHDPSTHNYQYSPPGTIPSQQITYGVRQREQFVPSYGHQIPYQVPRQPSIAQAHQAWPSPCQNQPQLRRQPSSSDAQSLTLIQQDPLYQTNAAFNRDRVGSHYELLPQPSPAQTVSAHSAHKNRAGDVTSLNKVIQQSPESPIPQRPELPKTEEEYQWDLLNAFREVLTDTTTPMAFPLPNTYTDMAIPVPAEGTSGVVSRYVLMASVEKWGRHIRDQLQWPQFEKDPVFMELDFNMPSIPLHEVVKRTLEQNGLMHVPTVVPKPQHCVERCTSDLQNDSPHELPRKRMRSPEQQDDFEQHDRKRIDRELHSFQPGTQGIILKESGGALPISPSTTESHTMSIDFDKHSIVVDEVWDRQPTQSTRATTPGFGIEDLWGIRTEESHTSKQRQTTPAVESDGAWAPQSGEGSSSTNTANGTEARRVVLKQVHNASILLAKPSERHPSPSNRNVRQDSGYSSAAADHDNDHDIPIPPPPSCPHPSAFGQSASRSPTIKGDESPLSPTSAFLLGSYNNESVDCTTDNNEMRQDSSLASAKWAVVADSTRETIDEPTPRRTKIKKRQPNVIEPFAYSRRW